jgi:diguanylate cyclase (GGDEF)-like protein
VIAAGTIDELVQNRPATTINRRACAMKSSDFHAEQLPAILRSAPLFQGVDLALLDGELRDTRPLCIEAGQVLLEPKHLNADIFIVLTGELLVCLEPRIVNPLVRLRVGDCVGELSIIDANPPSAYVVAATQTNLLAISKAVLWRMLARQPLMALNLLHVLTARIRENNVVLLGSLELQREYRNKAETDALTGLHNRVWFEEIFPKQLELCERTGQHACLLMIDIDHFKRVNDQYGHVVGDDALRHVAMLLRRNLRSTDLCARYGGEELIVLMPGAELSQAGLTAERLREAIANTPLQLADGRQFALQVSGGIAQWPPGTSLEDLVRAADQALYRAKNSGRNQIAVSLFTRGLGSLG